MAQVTGDADGLRRQARSYGRQAQAAESQVRQLRSTAHSIGVSKFTGPAGDQVRNYLSQLEGAASALAIAYDRIAIAAPQVADAIEDAKDAEKKRDEAQREMDAKSRELDSATGDLLVARIAASVPGGSGSHADVAQAQARVDRLTDLVNRLRGKLNNAQAAFEHADHHRDRLSRAFADLCRTQSAAIKRSVPAAPTPSPIGAQLAGQLGVLNYGQSALKTLIHTQGRLIIKNYEAPGGHATAGDRAFLKKLTDLGEKSSKIYSRVSNGLTVATNSYTALTDPKLSGHQKAEYITKHSGLQVAGGYVGGTLAGAGCAAVPVLDVATPVCATLGGMAGAFVFEEAAKLPGVRTAVNTVAKAPGAIYDEVDKILGGQDKKPTVWAGPSGPRDPTSAGSSLDGVA